MAFSIGPILQALLDHRRMSGSELASLAGINQSSVSRIVSGARKPTLPTMQALAPHLGLSDDLVALWIKSEKMGLDPDDFVAVTNYQQGHGRIPGTLTEEEEGYRVVQSLKKALQEHHSLMALLFPGYSTPHRAPSSAAGVSFANWLFEAMVLARQTIATLADKANIEEQRLIKFYNGDTVPNKSEIKKLAKALGVSERRIQTVVAEEQEAADWWERMKGLEARQSASRAPVEHAEIAAPSDLSEPLDAWESEVLAHMRHYDWGSFDPRRTTLLWEMDKKARRRVLKHFEGIIEEAEALQQ
jgi:transcriptional regulator with XRE-family HTH domain